MSEETLQENPKIRHRLKSLFRKRVPKAIKSYRNSNSSSPRLITLTIAIDRIDPLACVEILRQPDEFQFYWEHPERDFGIAGGHSCYEVDVDGEKRYQQIESELQEIQQQSIEVSEIDHSQSGLHYLGGFSFDDHLSSTLWNGFGAATFSIPGWLLIKDGNLGLLTLTLDVPENGNPEILETNFESRLEEIQPLLDFQQENDGIVKKSEPCWSKSIPQNLTKIRGNNHYRQWLENVNRARTLIKKGKFEKIVLSRELQVKNKNSISPTRALNRLRNLYTSSYCFLVEFPSSGSFIGCSPERLVQFNKRYIQTDALAGSISRGTSATQDMVLENRLLNSEKNRKEHDYVLKAITQSLQKLTTRIQHPQDPIVKKLSNVQHLYTPVLAWLKRNSTKADILQQLHPTPAVGGYPTETALSYIPELELFRRGWYASPVGWFNSSGGGEFTVAIRSGLIRDNIAHFFAGCGIVRNSDPVTEWEETKLKLIPMLSSVENG